MSKNNDNNKNINEPDELDPVTINPQMTESASSEHEADAPDVIQDKEDTVHPEVSDGEPEGEMSPDDLLENVRRSLITDTVEKEEAEQSRWWKRIIKGTRRKKEVDVPPPAVIDALAESPAVDAVERDGGQDEYVEQLDKLIDMLEDDTHADVLDEVAPAVHVDETTPEKGQQEHEVVDVEELKKRAFHARTTPEDEERSLNEVRSVALDDDGEEVFVEVEARVADPMRDRLKAIENAFRPYRNYFYFGFVFISLVMVLILSVSLYRFYLQSLPPPPVEEVAALPYPVGMNLPGGLSFKLGKGTLEEGRWNPRGPEWLEGTEVCRWIAIPYSRQLEAVVRTLTQEDQIELIMSNNDKLVYTVYSIDQLSIEEMQEIDSGSPCMMLVLAQSNTDKRWVVTAIP